MWTKRGVFAKRRRRLLSAVGRVCGKHLLNAWPAPPTMQIFKTQHDPTKKTIRTILPLPLIKHRSCFIEMIAIKPFGRFDCGAANAPQNRRHGDNIKWPPENQLNRKHPKTAQTRTQCAARAVRDYIALFASQHWHATHPGHATFRPPNGTARYMVTAKVVGYQGSVSWMLHRAFAFETG